MEDHYRRERIVLETSRHRISGEVTVPAEGHRTRLSDLLNREGGFIALVNVRISDLDGADSHDLPFIAVARAHIEIAYEDPGS